MYFVVILLLLLSIVSRNVDEINAFTVSSFSSSFIKTNNHKGFIIERCRSWNRRAGEQQQCVIGLRSTKDDNDDDDTKKKENPYQDPNFPELEFVDYSDPNYKVDQGMNEEFFAKEDDTEEVIEEMREERRLRNDEYQFETYFKDILKGGETINGEWIIYQTSTFLDDDDINDEISSSSNNAAGGMPKLRKVRNPLKVTSRGYKQEKTTTETTRSVNRLDNERILHDEKIITDDDEKLSEQAKQTMKDIESKTYWPTEMSAFDFRGQQGNMCVGSAYTLCTSVPLSSSSSSSGGEAHEGPFEEMRTELGIQSNQMRFRVKFDYSVKAIDTDDHHPPLHLKSLIVCRETLGDNIWPSRGKFDTVEDRKKYDALFGPEGAQGGLYDPPPVGCEKQAGQYMMIDLEGGATILFPYLVDQDPEVFTGSNGWVTSLDWTPGKIRYQVDRKVHSGNNVLGLRTLELSEVQGIDAEQYRPTDGGADMRQ